MSTMEGHELKRLYAGTHETSSIQPTCSCGWIGNPVHAWNDHQESLVKDQESDHCASVRSAPEAGGGRRQG